MRWVRHVEYMGKINTYKSLFRKHEGKRPLGRPGNRWEDNIKMYLTEVECERLD
jgi:hypothetical protein